MFYRLFKLLTVTGLLFFAFTAKAGGRAEKTQVPRHIVKQHLYLHIESLAEEISLTSGLVSEAPLTHFISHPACVADQLANLFSVPDGARASNIVLRNSQIPRRILLMLFPFHVFW
ncbi:hypothetical protein SAMN05192574_101976 [Mucilaginibacter gossypiicola]|uniref:Uncharacterized protein n=1 Tax=Mucilaginibacter gossypiicola TaxID=551995 RepID=A0A1H8BNL1_9SPHI|nr:hypothetical protein SAMN05192574_101976 [Mucilaginibacter gossypiicola]